MSTESIALNRFGLGARPEEAPSGDPRRWLLSQLDTYQAETAPWRGAARTPALVQEWIEQQRAARDASEQEKSAVRASYQRKSREAYQAAVRARVASALHSPAPFMERLVHFWANHFAVSVDKPVILGLAGALERDAIRPRILGRFEDLLLAAVSHPAMLLYLDQVRSAGPNSPAARRGRMRRKNAQGLNENLAREILELHTLGVRSGYTQDDVTEFARALTGWTLPREHQDGQAQPTFAFMGDMHEPGTRTVLGRSYPDDGEQQVRAILRSLALAPATARHIATKLARHFVADDPPPALVQRLSDTYLRTQGELAAVYRELINAPEAWAPDVSKFKSPWDWTISGLRALGYRDIAPNQAINLLNQLGQPV